MMFTPEILPPPDGDHDGEGRTWARWINRGVVAAFAVVFGIALYVPSMHVLLEPFLPLAIVVMLLGAILHYVL